MDAKITIIFIYSSIHKIVIKTFKTFIFHQSVTSEVQVKMFWKKRRINHDFVIKYLFFCKNVHNASFFYAEFDLTFIFKLLFFIFVDLLKN